MLFAAKLNLRRVPFEHLWMFSRYIQRIGKLAGGEDSNSLLIEPVHHKHYAALIRSAADSIKLLQ